ncbi:uncharacterized protein F4822DRAFT_423063 [Hypoxylon trugodes]|uniref:uncharacterized protein n=1 Tax=Hypoxylon trugodes TaxID=326681 RepID=UPI0021990FEA|nr:uncharacterized protein F4822DRAFT_423063 [Hypoxylon trugodes]KAI1382625.1 hypothetical protein F4822DRAFT_423063 [Hypoxylon trugodes]
MVDSSLGWEQIKINEWLERGMLTWEYILSQMDNNLQCCLPSKYAIEPEDIPALEAAFAFACVPNASGDGDILTELGFIILLQSKAGLPRCPEGIEVGRIIYGMVSYLRMIPFARRASDPLPYGLTIEELTRGLVWMIPDSAQYVIEESGFSRMLTLYDHQRKLFQSLATATPPLTAQDKIRARSRSLNSRYCMEVDDMFVDMCAGNHDDDGDEIYHDMLDVIYSTQYRPHPWMASVRRDKFRTVAKNLKVEGQIPELHTFAIPVQRFKNLVKVLLVLTFDPFTTGKRRNELNPSDFEDAAQCICNHFILDEDLGQDPSVDTNQNEEQLITWPSFSQALRASAPQLFEPFYRLLTLTFLEKSSWIWGNAAFDSLPIIPENSILTIPRICQLVSFLNCTVYPCDLQRMAHYSPTDFPTPTALIQAMQDVPQEAILLIAGHQVDTISREKKPYIFGFISPVPKRDGSCIQGPKEISSSEGMQEATLFQLAPIQDSFRGLVGGPGWHVVTDDDGGERLIIGSIPTPEDRWGDTGGVSLVLQNGCKNADIHHRSEIKRKRVYLANERRGEFKLELEVERIEIWSEIPEEDEEDEENGVGEEEEEGEENED